MAFTNSFSSFAQFLDDVERAETLTQDGWVLLQEQQRRARNEQPFGPALPTRASTLPMTSRPPAYQPKRSYSETAQNLRSADPWKQPIQTGDWIPWEWIKDERGRPSFRTGSYRSLMTEKDWIMEQKHRELLREKRPIRTWDDVTFGGVWVTRRIFPNGDMEESFDQGWTWKQWCPISINPWHAAYPRVRPIEQHLQRAMKTLASHAPKKAYVPPKPRRDPAKVWLEKNKKYGPDPTSNPEWIKKFKNQPSKHPFEEVRQIGHNIFVLTKYYQDEKKPKPKKKGKKVIFATPGPSKRR